ncbi:MarR family winged helix-turn-helix transcriptional regulator [Paenibacillus daejeonensis]|uniref:MarR family winged helix-turn-helix transcriptional regulator n=1 Tax=Paenibacillus daejeonensis TaxID=135193 RepID=UPI0003680502|nr:MarR family transcriptional regulator [Paenibacillus daejeonensis]
MTRHEEESLTRLMVRTHKLFRHNVDLQIRAFDVYPGQPPLLLRLVRMDGLSQKELAGHMHVQPATLTVMINRMAKNGLLERRPDDRDQRVQRVFLTEKGRTAAAAVQDALGSLEEYSFARFSDSEKALFRELLERMRTDLEAFRAQQEESEEKES